MSEAKAMFGVWQPMETAPRDRGRRILLQFQGDCLQLCMWGGVVDEWYYGNCVANNPVRWMPLPDDGNNPMPDLLANLEAVLDAWTKEANMGDGIMEEHGEVYDAAKALINKIKGGAS